MTTRLHPLRLLVTGLLLTMAPVSIVLYRLAYGDGVPDPLPTHWGPGGQVDDTLGLTAFTVMALVSTAVLAVVGVALLGLLRRYPLTALGVVLASGTGWLMATTYAATLTAAEGATTAADVPLQPALLVAILLVPAMVAVVTWFLVPLAPRSSMEVTAPPSPIAVRAGERVTWVGQASSPGLLLGALLLVLAAVSTVFVLWPVALVLGLAALAVAWVHRIMVRVDNTALTVAWGPIRWPRVSVPLNEVTAAHAATIEPLEWGGWGYRVTPRGHAAVTRRGPGLVLSRRGRAAFAVTVDAPEGAVDLVNAVVVDQEAADR